MKQNSTLLETLLELQHLDRVPRMGFVLRGVADPESVSEHLWHVTMLVWTREGDAYTKGEYAAWLRAAGFSGVRRLRLMEPGELLVARKG